jgi:hypothetical protein
LLKTNISTGKKAVTKKTAALIDRRAGYQRLQPAAQRPLLYLGTDADVVENLLCDRCAAFPRRPTGAMRHFGQQAEHLRRAGESPLRSPELKPSYQKEQHKRGAGDHDKTVSRSCLVQKRKNFVSRGADHFAALRGLAAWG